MSEPITPALSKEEWAALCDREYPGEPNTAGLTDDGRLMLCAPDGTCWFVGAHKRHTHAALALHGQPFGFSHDDVKALQSAIAYDPTTGWLSGKLESLASRISALLKPEDNT